MVIVTVEYKICQKSCAKIQKFQTAINYKNIKSCDQNSETIWSHDLRKIKFGIIKLHIAF